MQLFGWSLLLLFPLVSGCSISSRLVFFDAGVGFVVDGKWTPWPVNSFSNFLSFNLKFSVINICSHYFGYFRVGIWTFFKRLFFKLFFTWPYPARAWLSKGVYRKSDLDIDVPWATHWLQTQCHEMLEIFPCS
jgi:hypothetical protein